MTLALLTAVVALSPALKMEPNILSYVQSNLKDVAFTAKVKSGNQAELRKIDEDFGRAYRCNYALVDLKDPFKLRVESVVEDQSLLVISNGTHVLYKVPRAGIHSRQNLADQPGRRQSFLDFGLLTPSLFDGFLGATFVRKDRATGDMVFDLKFSPPHGNSTRYRVWIDPEKHFTTRREWYGQEGDLRAIMFYSAPVKVNDCWIPTDFSVKNADDKIAGQMIYEKIKVNQGLEDSLFSTN